MAIYFPDTMFAGVVLVRSAMRSPNYVAGTSGWTINQDGTVEFNNGTFRGTLVIGTTTVRTVGTTGITVVGVDQTMTITNSAGFKVVKTTADGRTAQLDLSSSTGNSSLSRLLLTPVTPTAAANVVANAAQINATITGAAAAEAGLLNIQSPRFTGKAISLIQMLGQTGGSAVDDTVIFYQAASHQIFGATVITGNASASGSITGGSLAITGNGDIDGTLRLGPGNQEIGQGVISGDSQTASSAAIAATETVILTGNSATFFAGHVYRATVYGVVSASVAPNDPVFRLRKTNAAGQVLGFSRIDCRTVAPTEYNCMHTILFRVTGSNVTAVIVLTLQGSATFNAVHVGAATNNRGFFIEDLGSSANAALPNLVTLV